MSSLLVLDCLAAKTPEGRQLFEGLTFSIGARDRIGVVGRNGSGKSTLLSIINGDVAPAAGQLVLNGRVGILLQSWPESLSVADALAISDTRRAINRIVSGEASDEDFATADWNLEARAAQALGEVELGGLDLDRKIRTLSGGERTRVGLARLLIEAPDLILLDEPTNNLDADGRAAIRRLLSAWPGGAIVASHDRELLEAVDRIVELSPAKVTQVGGGWSTYAAARDADRRRAEAELDAAARNLRAAERGAQQRREAQARRDKAGRVFAASGSAPKILLGRQAERAENSSGRGGRLSERKTGEALERLSEARSSVEVITPLMIDLPGTGLPPTREVLTMEAATVDVGTRRFGPWSITIRGPERIALLGRNGAGKSTFLRLVLGSSEPSTGAVRRGGRMALLDQHVGLLNLSATIISNFLILNPEASFHEAHAALARFAFRNSDADRITGTLSGGERLRAGLACVLGGTQPAELLMLDEPTNHLDISTVEELEGALAHYDGALLIVSHDEQFLRGLGVTRTFQVAGH